MSPRAVSPFRVVLYAAIVGSVLGVVLSFYKQAQAARELEAAIEEEQRYDAVPVDPPAKDARLPQDVKLQAVEGLPQYPGANVHPLSEQIAHQGVEMHIAWFETKDSVDDVLIFYRQKFQEAGKWGVWHLYSDRAGYAGWLDHDSGRMHLISALRQGDKTVVFPSVSYPAQMLEGKAAMPSTVPTIPGSEGNLVFDFGDGARLSKVFLSTVKEQSLRQVVDGYKRSLIERGWAVDEKLAPSAETARVDARRQGSGLQVDFKRDPDSTVSVSVTMLPDA